MIPTSGRIFRSSACLAALLVSACGRVPVTTGTSAVIGPAGGHFVFAGGVSLDVPAGAIDHDVAIEVRSLPGDPGPGGIELVRPVIELLPSGTQFVLPLILTMPRPSDGAGHPYPIDALSSVTYELDGDETEELVLSFDASQRLKALLWHFSRNATGRMPDPPSGSVGAVALLQAQQEPNTPGKCSTVPLTGLSDQIRVALLARRPNALVEVVQDDRLRAEENRSIFLQPSVALDLLRALNDPTVPNPAVMQVNASWRSIADQYLLSRCGNTNETARITTSNHLSGVAIDVQPQRLGIRKEDCQSLVDGGVQPFSQVHATWGAALETASFDWSRGCKDQPHFDHVDHAPSAVAVDLRAAGVLAFMDVWDRYNPCDLIDHAERTLAENASSALSESQLTDTLAKLILSPAGGFIGQPVARCMCGDAQCGVNETAANCPSDCGDTDAGLDGGMLDAQVLSDAGVQADGGAGGGSMDGGVDGGAVDSGVDGGAAEGGVDAGLVDAGVDAGPGRMGPTVTIGSLEWDATWNSNTYDWTTADAYCVNLVLNGQSDWRLPTAHELMLSMDYMRASPAVDPAKFPGVPASAVLWASDDASVLVAGRRWAADVAYGQTSYWPVNAACSVRCVRGTSPPAGQFVDNGNGTVTDTGTGLIWQQMLESTCACGQAYAAAYCSALVLGGSGPGTWRLPTVTELDSIVDRAKFAPAVDWESAFPNATPEFCWSSSTFALDGTAAWGVDFGYGTTAYFDVRVGARYRCVH